MTRTNVALLLSLLSSLACSAGTEVSDGSAEDIDVVESTLPKRPTTAGGKCHVSFGGYTVIVAGTYSADGSCCGKALCSDGCDPGEKYIDVCIDCSADEDVQCGDGHHPVARTHTAIDLGALSTAFQP